jgi:hypothetical protein
MFFKANCDGGDAPWIFLGKNNMEVSFTLG